MKAARAGETPSIRAQSHSRGDTRAVTWAGYWTIHYNTRYFTSPPVPWKAPSGGNFLISGPLTHIHLSMKCLCPQLNKRDMLLRVVYYQESPLQRTLGAVWKEGHDAKTNVEKQVASAPGGKGRRAHRQVPRGDRSLHRVWMTGFPGRQTYASTREG